MKAWNGKKKAVTFSYDDGVISDIRLLEVMNKYKLKGTFNLNSGLLGSDHTWMCKGFEVIRLNNQNLKELYKGHEIAVHGKMHLHLLDLDPSEIEDEILSDQHKLEEFFNTKITGMAYSFGEYDSKVIEVLKKAHMKYARTVSSTHNFDLQDDLLEFNPTCHHSDKEIFHLINQFLESDSDKPQLLYIWGHAYEFDVDNNWDYFENLCKVLSGRDDVFYGTNSEVL